MRILQICLVALVLISAVSSTSAFAWGCKAVASNGGYGWSKHFGSRDQAIIVALEECGGEGRHCRIVWCDRWK